MPALRRCTPRGQVRHRSAAMPTGWPCFAACDPAGHSPAREQGSTGRLSPCPRYVLHSARAGAHDRSAAMPFRLAVFAPIRVALPQQGQASTGRLSPCPRYGAHRAAAHVRSAAMPSGWPCSASQDPRARPHTRRQGARAGCRHARATVAALRAGRLRTTVARPCRTGWPCFLVRGDPVGAVLTRGSPGALHDSDAGDGQFAAAPNPVHPFESLMCNGLILRLLQPSF